MKNSVTIMRPIKERSKSAFATNMFRDPQMVEESNGTDKNNQIYDYVGSQQFRKKMISRHMKPIKQQSKEIEKLEQPILFNQTANSKTFFNTTINRNTILSSLHKQQQIQITKQSRNLDNHKDYKQIWERNKNFIRLQLKKKSPLLMDNNIKSLYVHPNQDKTDVINNFIVHYWEMSLRNNNPILQRHIKGHHFQKVQKEKLLQLRGGIKKIEDSIPALPIEKLASLKYRDLSVSGRNKIGKQSLSNSNEYNSTRYSIPNSGRVAQQQVLKINYQGDKKWMGSENL